MRLTSVTHGLTTVALLACLAAPAQADDAPGPALTVSADRLAASLSCPQSFKGTSDPILLVHGTSTDAEAAWSWGYVPALTRLGKDVCTVDLPDTSLGDIQVASEYVVYALREISRRGRRPVAVIGHSQGGLQPRWAIKWWPDVRTLLSDYISLSTTNHGAPLADAFCSANACRAALWQQRSRSALLKQLNDGDEAPGAGAYTSIFSQTDTTATPPTSNLEGSSLVAVQAICPGREVSHDRMLSDAVAFAVVLDALEHDGPARRDRIDPAVCAQDRATGVDTATGDQREQTNPFRSVVLIASGEQLVAEPPLARYTSTPVADPALVVRRTVRRVRAGRTTSLRFDLMLSGAGSTWTPPGMCLALAGQRRCADEGGTVRLRVRLRRRGLRCGTATAFGVAPRRVCARVSS